VILANSCITTLFRHKNVGQTMREHFGLTSAELHRVKFAKTGKETGYSTALFITGTTRTPMRVEAAEFEHWLITSDPDEVKAKFVASAPAPPPRDVRASEPPVLVPGGSLAKVAVAAPRSSVSDGYPSYFAASVDAPPSRPPTFRGGSTALADGPLFVQSEEEA